MPVIVQRRCRLLLFVCGEHSAPSRTPFRSGDKNCSPCHRNGVHFHNGILFGFTTEWCSASDRNRVHLRPDSPDHWLPEYTSELLNVLIVIGLLVELEPKQADLLEHICAGPLISNDELEAAGAFTLPPKPKKTTKKKKTGTPHMFETESVHK